METQLDQEGMEEFCRQVTVVIPLYNKRETILRALQSVNACRVTGKINVIVVDDGSIDLGGEVVDRASFGNLNISLFRQANQGVSAARNYGLAACNTEHVCFLDADDEWQPWFLEAVFRLIKDYPDCNVFSVGYSRVEKKDGTTRTRRFKNRRYSEYRGTIFSYSSCVLYGDACITASSVCMKTNSLKAIGGFPVGVTHSEDRITWMRLLHNSSLAFDSTSGMLRHESDNNSSSTWVPKKGKYFLQEISHVKYDQSNDISKLRAKEHCRFACNCVVRRHFRESLPSYWWLIRNLKIKEWGFVTLSFFINYSTYVKLKRAVSKSRFSKLN